MDRMQDTFISVTENIALLMSIALLHAAIRRRFEGRPDRWSSALLLGLTFACGSLACVPCHIDLKDELPLDIRMAFLGIATLFGGGVPGLMTLAALAVFHLCVKPAAFPAASAALISVFAICFLLRRSLSGEPKTLRSVHLLTLGAVLGLVTIGWMLVNPLAPARDVLLGQVALPVILSFSLSVGLLGGLIAYEERRLDIWRALRASEERLRTIFNAMPVLLDAFDEDGNFIYWNAECERTTGFSASEIVGNPEALTRLYPDEAVRERIRREIQNSPGEFRNVLFEVTGKNGIKRTVAWSNVSQRVPIPGWAQWAVGIDVTERVRAQEDYRVLFDRMLDGYALHELIADDAGNPVNYRYLAVNPAFERLTGLAAREVVGRTVLEVLPNLEPYWLERFGRVGVTGVPDHFENYAQEIGKHFEVTAFCTGPLQFACVFVDITERKKAEKERMRLEAQIQHAQKLESLGVLAGGIAHDFNNLLMGVLGYADIALNDLPSAAPARESVEEIIKASRRAADLVKQMLAYSGRGHFVVQPLDLSELVGEMAHLLEISVSKQAILRYKFAEHLPAIEADATQVRQIVMNLITNASDAIGGKSGVISIATGAMDCDRAYLSESYLDENLPEGTYVYVEVSDTGAGMDHETQSKIFDPFFTTKFTGRGLGLAATLGIVRGHRGAIKVYSEKDRGTCFKVLFPASALPAQHERSEEAPDEPWTDAGTLLLVDDDETVRALGKTMIERMGFTVLTACDGREGVAAFREHQKDIALVLLDMTMPHMDGEETFRELRRIDSQVRVILSSGYNEQEATNRFTGKGLAGFIQKPYRRAQLYEMIKAALDR